MARYSRFASLVGLEDDAVDTADTPTNEVEEVKQDMEYEQTSGDVDAALDTAESAQDDTDTLIEIRDIINDKLEDGEGVDETTAAVVEETVENIYRRMGIPRRHRQRMISRESFRGGRSERLRATKGLVDQLTSVVTTIVNFFKKIWRAISDLFRKLFNYGLGKAENAYDICDGILKDIAAANDGKDLHDLKTTEIEYNLTNILVPPGEYNGDKISFSVVIAYMQKQVKFCDDLLGKLEGATPEGLIMNDAKNDQNNPFDARTIFIDVYKQYKNLIGVGTLNSNNQYDKYDGTVSYITGIKLANLGSIKNIAGNIKEKTSKSEVKRYGDLRGKADKLEGDIETFIERKWASTTTDNEVTEFKNRIGKACTAYKEAVNNLIKAYGNGYYHCAKIMKKIFDECFARASTKFTI